MSWQGVVEPAEAGERVDVVLTGRRPDLSRAAIQRLLRQGYARVDDRPARPGQRLKAGQRLSLEIPPPEPSALAPEPIPLDLPYEDEDLLVVNKPRGLVVHPGAGRRSGTLVNALLAHCTDLSGVGGVLRPGIVHRLDKDTSGLLVVAKTDAAHRHLAAQLRSRRLARRYLALVWGEPREDHFVISLPIGRHRTDRTRMAAVPTPAPGRRVRSAETEICVRERFGPISLVEAALRTGRTHQIRVHLSHHGYPLVGDPTYGRRRAGEWEALLDPEARRAVEALRGQALHAYQLSFVHPRTGERLTFTAELPADMAALLARLRGSRTSSRQIRPSRR